MSREVEALMEVVGEVMVTVEEEVKVIVVAVVKLMEAPLRVTDADPWRRVVVVEEVRKGDAPRERVREFDAEPEATLVN